MNSDHSYLLSPPWHAPARSACRGNRRRALQATSVPISIPSHLKHPVDDRQAPRQISTFVPPHQLSQRDPALLLEGSTPLSSSRIRNRNIVLRSTGFLPKNCTEVRSRLGVLLNDHAHTTRAINPATCSARECIRHVLVQCACSLSRAIAMLRQSVRDRQATDAGFSHLPHQIQTSLDEQQQLGRAGEQFGHVAGHELRCVCTTRDATVRAEASRRLDSAAGPLESAVHEQHERRPRNTGIHSRARRDWL